MSVRQDSENKNCPSRGLGIAAAAIGVGVGAALYYLFSKREDPDSSGATSSWTCEREHALSSSDASFTTISEHSTSDTSMNSTIDVSNDNNESFNSTSDNETSFNRINDNERSFNSTSDNETSFNRMSDNETSFNRTSDNETSFNRTSDNETSFNSTSEISFTGSSDNDTSGMSISNESSASDDSITETLDLLGTEFNDPSLSLIGRILRSGTSLDTRYMTLTTNSSNNGTSSSLTRINSIDSDTNTEWDVTNSSLDVPNVSRRNLPRGESSASDDSITETLDLLGTEFNDPSISLIGRILRSGTSLESGYMTLTTNSSNNGTSSSLTRINSIDSDTNTEWDVTNSSLDVPNESRRNLPRGFQRIINSMLLLASPIVSKRSRERTWSPEECSICFDMMTQTQEVMALPCTHRFHQACILPWLQERQTCPNCRKTA